MFALETVTPSPGKMDARKEVRMHRTDEERIRAAAAATGLQEADFIRQGALLRAQEIEQRMSLSIVPIEAFNAAVNAPAIKVPGLPRDNFAARMCWRHWPSCSSPGARRRTYGQITVPKLSPMRCRNG